MRHGKLELVATLMLIFSVTICERINSPQRDQDEENEEKFPMIIEEQNIEDSGYPVKPLDIILVVIYGIITTVGLIANGIVFFVIFARDEISKSIKKFVYGLRLRYRYIIALCKTCIAKTSNQILHIILAVLRGRV